MTIMDQLMSRTRTWLLEPGAIKAVSRVKEVKVVVVSNVSMVTLLQRGTCFSRSAGGGEALPLCTTETCDTDITDNLTLILTLHRNYTSTVCANSVHVH